MQPIEHNLTVKATPEAAFAAVATPAGIKGWWARDSDVGRSAGEPIELRFNKPDMSAVMNFELTDLQPGRRVEWTCTRNSNPIWPGSRLIWEVEAAASGSVVHFRHEGFSDGGPAYDRTVEGWQLFMDSLQSYLDRSDGHPSD
jgi:uncharacterized protein YndB with AHSA1/START domain